MLMLLTPIRSCPVWFQPQYHFHSSALHFSGHAENHPRGCCETHHLHDQPYIAFRGRYLHDRLSHLVSPKMPLQLILQYYLLCTTPTPHSPASHHMKFLGLLCTRSQNRRNGDNCVPKPYRNVTYLSFQRLTSCGFKMRAHNPDTLVSLGT